MDLDDAYKRIEATLYKDADEAAHYLNSRELEMRQRVMVCVSKRMDNPFIEDTELVAFIENGCGGILSPVKRSQAYNYLTIVNRMLGNIKLAAKSWYRYMIVEGAKKAYALAMKNDDAKGAAAALDKIGKYTQCDKDDERMDYTKMIPPSFEPSDDITLIEGLQKVDDIEQRRRELRALAKGVKFADIEEADIVGADGTDEQDAEHELTLFQNIENG